MKFVSIQEAIKKKRGNIAIRGWVYRERKLKERVFLVLRDHSNILQCVVNIDSVPNEVWRDANKLLIESSVEIFGAIKPEKRAPTKFEVDVTDIKVVNFSEKYPITQDQSAEVLLDNRHLWIRSRKMTSILKIRSTVFGATHEYFRKNGYYEFQSPSLTPGVAEEGPTLFEVNYFGKKVYLTQTWQLYAEAGIFALEKIYCIAPSFRAERSKTSRHLTEYWHIEVETAWMDLEGLIKLAEGLVKHIIKRVLKSNQQELMLLKRDVKVLERSLKKKFPRITYDRALGLLKEKKNLDVPWGKDLRTVEEDKLMELFDVPVFVTNYPKKIMAFYKPRDKKNPEVARCFDCLMPEGYGELIGGSERDIDINELKNSLKGKGENIENYKFYFDLRRYGSVPHAGFGLGAERLISWICGLDNIKDAIAFPRTMLRYTP